jgi:hypothetical protein
MNVSRFSLAVEGIADAAVAQRILRHLGLEAGPINGLPGKADLDQCLTGYNHAAKYLPWLVLRDLDRDACCAPELLPTLLRKPATKMCLRIAVRAVESWLLADRHRMSQFLGVALNKLPANPDQLDDPKTVLVNMARKSRKKIIREDMVPAPGSSTRVGPAYSARIIEYADAIWRPDIAADHSNSLRRCIAALERVRSSP